MIFINTFSHGCLVVNGDIRFDNDKTHNFISLYIGTKDRLIFQYKKTGQSDGEYFIDIVYCNKSYDYKENEEDSIAIKQIKALEKWIGEQIKKYCSNNVIQSNNVKFSGNAGIVSGGFERSEGEVPVDNYFIDLLDYKGELPKEYI